MRRFAFNFSQQTVRKLSLAVSTSATAAVAYGAAGFAPAPSELLPTQSNTSSTSTNVSKTPEKPSKSSTFVSTTPTQSIPMQSSATDTKYGDLYESYQLHDIPLDMDITFFETDWEDWYKNKINLIFTEPQDSFTLKDGTIINNNNNIKCRMERVVRATQEHLCNEIINMERSAREELLNNGIIINNENDINIKSFVKDFWKRPQERCGIASKYAGGITMVLSDSIIFEKAGVSVSISSGKLPKQAVPKMTANHNELQQLLLNNKLGDKDGNVEYFAASVSSVIHPYNPHAPTGHFNYRYFELGDKQIIETTDNNDNNTQKEVFIPKIWWFGGGGDLTPAVLYKEDCKHFHSVFKNVCDKYGSGIYRKFKKWCDNYFVINHRDYERRGIGGIFFDDIINVGDVGEDGKIEEIGEMNDEDKRERVFEFIKDLASVWHLNYLPLVKRHGMQKYTKEEKEWQQIRRGRYVEFNLVYDRGTKFGLMKPGARYESILMSLPLTANWQYCRGPLHDFEKKMYEAIINPVDWI